MSLQRFIANCLRTRGLLLAGMLVHSVSMAQDAVALRSHYAALRDNFTSTQFGRPLVLESTESSGDLRGDVYVVVDHAFTLVAQGLQSIDHWCDILILHLNVKQCKANSTIKMIDLRVGRKFDQPVSDAYELAFKYRLATDAPDYLRVLLSADEGPLGTKDYRIQVEAIPVEDSKSVIHMSYAYGYGFTARMAMQTYLLTLGRNKVGFSIIDHRDGKPVFIGGVLGLLERNTMRYYLAIDAYLGALGLPPEEQAERRIRDWYASTDRYARQLHEMSQGDYLDMKRKELHREP